MTSLPTLYAALRVLRRVKFYEPITVTTILYAHPSVAAISYRDIIYWQLDRVYGA